MPDLAARGTRLLRPGIARREGAWADSMQAKPASVRTAYGMVGTISDVRYVL